MRSNETRKGNTANFEKEIRAGSLFDILDANSNGKITSFQFFDYLKKNGFSQMINV